MQLCNSRFSFDSTQHLRKGYAYMWLCHASCSQPTCWALRECYPARQRRHMLVLGAVPNVGKLGAIESHQHHGFCWRRRRLKVWERRWNIREGWGASALREQSQSSDPIVQICDYGKPILLVIVRRAKRTLGDDDHVQSRHDMLLVDAVRSEDTPSVLHQPTFTAGPDSGDVSRQVAGLSVSLSRQKKETRTAG